MPNYKTTFRDEFLFENKEMMIIKYVIIWG